MEDVAVIFGQPQLLVVDLPYADSMEEFAQQDSMISEVLEAVHHLDTSYAAFYTALSDDDDEFVRTKPFQSRDSTIYMHLFFIIQYTRLLARRDAPLITTSSGSCAAAYGVKDADGSYCALLCLTNGTILYWETKSDLKMGRSPCVAQITAFDEGYAAHSVL